MRFFQTAVSVLLLSSPIISFSWSYEDDSEESHLRGRALKDFPPKGFTIDPLNNCSITCAPCPIGCLLPSCSSTPVYLPPKAEIFPPVSAMQRPFGPSPKARNATAEYVWWTTEVLAKYPKMLKQSDTKYALSSTEVTPHKMSLTEWMDARAAGKYTCVDIATAMVKRALYLQEIQKMQQIMYWGTFDWIKVVLKSMLRNWTIVLLKKEPLRSLLCIAILCR